ncbi:MAG: YncE family protein [Bacteroidales bacterium]|jgi:sugar lactone lactonase YvrE|nr:YncE family protein [Bacteroidales bacterium]
MFKRRYKFRYVFFLVSATLFISCRGDEEEIIPPGVIPVTPGESSPVKGFFLLNEANMGSNKASIDYFDSDLGKYYQNIYPAINPNVVHELGDVGNGIKVYGGKLYAVINVSGYVEVMDVNTAKHVSTITIPSLPNLRDIVFDEGYAYVSSYNGPVHVTPDAPPGCVVKVDTATMTEVGRVTVGYQPEEMAIRGKKLYVANSGGYRAPNYDNTVSVIDLNDFTREQKRITVGINPHRMKLDSDSNIYVSSRGDARDIPSNTYIIDRNDAVSKSLDLPCNNMAAGGDSMYVCSVEWSSVTRKNTITYAIVNTKTQTVVSRNFITDGTEQQIVFPYGIAIHPENRDIYVTDARDRVNPGVLYCFDRYGKRRWSVVTGDIPAHMAFTRKALQNLDMLEPGK